MPWGEFQVSSDFAHFLIGFLKENPKFIDRPLWVVGESYAGHYIPAIGKYLYEANITGINL